MRLIRALGLALPVVLVALAASSGDATAAAGPPAAGEPGLYDRLAVHLLVWQRQYHRDLTAQLRDISDGGGWISWSLVVASFLYGVFHAAGPGHGKAVLSAYLLTHREAVRRGVALSLAASACQGLVALVVVYGFVWLAGLVMHETQATLRWAERASYAVVVAMGGWLVWRAALALFAQRHLGHDGHDHHGHAHPHHLPNPPAEATRAARLLLVLSIGLRPCSGAVIVLVFAQAVGIPWTGVLAVAAISLGTGLAVVLLALLAVNLRNWAARAVVVDIGFAARIAAAVGVLGGLAIAALGVALLDASFAPVHPLGL